jgi:hypothetical protein
MTVDTIEQWLADVSFLRNPCLSCATLTTHFIPIDHLVFFFTVHQSFLITDINVDIIVKSSESLTSKRFRDTGKPLMHYCYQITVKLH